jgi:hypothetical protein
MAHFLLVSSRSDTDMKRTFIVLNLLAAVAFIFLGSCAAAIHRVHSYSMYREFVTVGAVDEQKLATLPQPPGLPPSPHYDMPARLRQIGNAEFWFSCLSNLAAAACVINAIAIFFLVKKRDPSLSSNLLPVEPG